MSTALTEFVAILIAAIQDLGTGIAAGVANMASKLFLKETSGSVTGLSVFGGIVAIFAGRVLPA